MDATNSGLYAKRMSELPLKAQVLPVTPYQQNCSLVWCTRTRRAAVIGPIVVPQGMGSGLQTLTCSIGGVTSKTAYLSVR